MAADIETQDRGEEIATVTQARVEDGSPDAPGCVLRVVDGPDTGREFTFDGTQASRIFIGKSPASDVVLSDVEVSRRHAALDSSDRLRLSDLGSTNGTWVNGVSVTECFLRGGETIMLGRTVLTVAVTSTAPRADAAPPSFGRVVGTSAEMRRLYRACEKIARSELPVVLEGETGTGKELLAEALHEASPRANAPFVVFDCTTVPANLIESALFGHERGAFTGATESRKGVFEEADGGTLLIDEIGDLDIMLQPKLLRALQSGQIQRVGSNKWIKIDVRVIAATRRDLERAIQTGRFRDDLYFRLAVARLELPPLRRRGGDVAILAQYFWKKLGGAPAPLPPDFLVSVERYPWPGNVRELHNAVARRLAVGQSAPEPFAPQLEAAKGLARSTIDLEAMGVMDLPLTRAREVVVAEFEQYYVDRVLERHGGNVRQAADAAGIARRYFQLLRAKQRLAR